MFVWVHTFVSANMMSFVTWYFQVSYLACSSQIQDAERMEKVSRRVTELETVGNNIKLLAEMLQHYSASSSSEGERDLMKVRRVLQWQIQERGVALVDIRSAVPSGT